MNKGYESQLAIQQLKLLYEFWEEHPDFTYTFNLIVDYPGETLESVKNTLAIVTEEPQLFFGRVAACCRFHLYEGTPEYVRLGSKAIGCLSGLLPPGVDVPSFRYLFPSERADTEKRSRMILIAGRYNYRKIFGTDAVIIAYITTGDLPEYRETRRRAMCAWAQEVLADLHMENWSRIFRFASVEFD
jgi:hypothetical protein